MKQNHGSTSYKAHLTQRESASDTTPLCPAYNTSHSALDERLSGVQQREQAT